MTKILARNLNFVGQFIITKAKLMQLS